jgi:hypothetical protein
MDTRRLNPRTGNLIQTNRKRGSGKPVPDGEKPSLCGNKNGMDDFLRNDSLTLAIHEVERQDVER